MNNEVPVNISQKVIRTRFLISGNVLGWEENCFGKGKVLLQRRVCENKFATVCKTKESFKRYMSPWLRGLRFTKADS